MIPASRSVSSPFRLSPYACLFYLFFLMPFAFSLLPAFNLYIRFLIASATGLVNSATITAYIAKLPTASLR